MIDDRRRCQKNTRSEKLEVIKQAFPDRSKTTSRHLVGKTLINDSWRPSNATSEVRRHREREMNRWFVTGGHGADMRDD